MFPHVYAVLLASPGFALLYFLGCKAVAYYGRRTRIGYWGFFFLSLLFTPLATLIFLFFSKQRRGSR
jgi:hypothetical protein